MAREPRSRIVSFFTIVGWTVTILGLLSKGYLSVTHAGYALVGLVVLAAIAHNLGTTILRVAFGILLPSVGLVLLVIREGEGNAEQMRAIATAIIALIVALYGIFFMITRR